MKYFALLTTLLLLSSSSGLAQPPTNRDLAAIDFDKARALFAKQRKGETLSAEEKQYLERAAKERQSSKRKADPTTGDNLSSRTEAHVPGIDIPLSVSPLQIVKLESPDGVDLSFAYRVPRGRGPHPTVLFFHGGGEYGQLENFKNDLLDKPIQTRFLSQGFVVVQCTRRPFWKTPKQKMPNGFYEAVEDSRLIVETTKALPEVDENKIILFGGSGGGILAIVTASITDVACVIAGEPASVVPLALKTNERGGGRAYQPVMNNPREFFIGKTKKVILNWMNKINCPILVLQGKPVLLYRANFDFLIPEMKKLGKEISSLTYPNMIHGFYWGKTKSGATDDLVKKLMADMTSFIERSTD